MVTVSESVIMLPQELAYLTENELEFRPPLIPQTVEPEAIAKWLKSGWEKTWLEAAKSEGFHVGGVYDQRLGRVIMKMRDAQSDTSTFRYSLQIAAALLISYAAEIALPDWRTRRSPTTVNERKYEKSTKTPVDGATFLGQWQFVQPIDFQLPTIERDGSHDEVCLVSIPRAGLPMQEVGMKMLRDCVAHLIGLYRGPNAKPYVYQMTITPAIRSHKILLLDPMLATGGSIIAAVKILAAFGVPEENITVVSVFAAPEGVLAVKKECPGVRIVAGSLDWCLNANAYILPGCGDAGDRIFRTEGAAPAIKFGIPLEEVLSRISA